MCTRVNQDRDQSHDTTNHLDLIVIDNLSSLESQWNLIRALIQRVDAIASKNQRTTSKQIEN